MKQNSDLGSRRALELNFQHLRYFWAVAREGNLTRAAAQFHVSQSAVSVQLKKLEEMLGHELFERRGRRLELTHAGHVTFDYAEGIFGLGAELLGMLDDQSEARRQTLRVGVLATLSRNFQIGFLGELIGRKDVHLVVRSGGLADLVERLESHQLDVVLTNSSPARAADSTWVPHLIDQQPVSLIGHQRIGRKRSLSRLLAEEALVLPSAESGIRAGFDALTERLGVQPRIVAEIDDMAMLRLVTREHEGLAVIPPIVVREELEEASLVEVQRLPDLVENFLALTVPRRIRHKLLSELFRPRE